MFDLNSNDAYANSDLAARFEDSSSRLAIFDVDGTIAGDPGDYGGGLAKEYMFSLLREHEVPWIFSSARTAELMMSEASYKASRRLGFNRPLPRRGLPMASMDYSYAPLEQLPEFEGFLDPYGIIGLGTGIFLRHGKGYRPDIEYENELGRLWRGNTLDLIERISIDGDLVEALAPIECEIAYACGETDVFPLPYRIQFEFSGINAYERMVDAKFRIAASQLGGNLNIVDESSVTRKRFLFYITPKGATKKDALTRVVQKLSGITGRPVNECSLFIAGDTLTDLPCCDSAPSARTTFVLAGHSRLGPYLSQASCGEAFAGESLAWMRERLTSTGEDGTYYFNTADGSRRNFVISDEVCPGMRAAQSIAYQVEKWLGA